MQAVETNDESTERNEQQSVAIGMDIDMLPTELMEAVTANRSSAFPMSVNLREANGILQTRAVNSLTFYPRRCFVQNETVTGPT